jgi:hypothetical protein
MVTRSLDLEMEWCHVVKEARVDEVVGISAVIRAMLGRAVEEARNRAYGLQEGWDAQFIK